MSRLYGVSALPSPPIIHIGSRVAFGAPVLRTNAGVPTSNVSPWSDAANALIAFPFQLEAARTTFYKTFIWQGSAGAASTNWEIGIWDSDYNKLVTTGSFAGTASANVPLTNALSATTTLPPGLYYAGIAHSATTTNQCFRSGVATSAIWQMLGCWRQSGITIGSLAATATPGDMSNISFPLFGLITRTVFDL